MNKMPIDTTLAYAVVNGDTLLLDGTWAEARLIVPHTPTAFDSIRPCDIKLLEIGDTGRAESFIGTIKPNVCDPIEKSLSDKYRDASDVLMFTFTVYAVLKLVYKVVFMPRLNTV